MRFVLLVKSQLHICDLNQINKPQKKGNWPFYRKTVRAMTSKADLKSKWLDIYGKQHEHISRRLMPRENR
jgi:hypothetical protein